MATTVVEGIGYRAQEIMNTYFGDVADDTFKIQVRGSTHQTRWLNVSDDDLLKIAQILDKSEK